MNVTCCAGDCSLKHVRGDLIKPGGFASLESVDDGDCIRKRTNMVHCSRSNCRWWRVVVVVLDLVVRGECGVFLLSKVSSEQIVLFKVSGDYVALCVSVVRHCFGIVGTFAQRRSIAERCLGVLPCSAVLVKVCVRLVLCREMLDVCGSVLSEFGSEHTFSECEEVSQVEVAVLSLSECVGVKS